MASLLDAISALLALAALLWVLPRLLTYVLRSRRRTRAAAAALPSPCAHRFVFVIVNPNAGSGAGKTVYEDVVKPLLERAGVKHGVAFTTRPGHAREICEEVLLGRHDIDNQHSFDCIVAVSGDGMLHECLNGVMRARAAIPLAIVPAGSGNGVAETLYGRGCDATTAMLAILSGRPRKVDVLAMDPIGASKGRTPTYDLHFFCWAVFADHDYLVRTTNPSPHMYVYMYIGVNPIYIYICVCVYVSIQYLYIHIYIFVCLYVCMYVYTHTHTHIGLTRSAVCSACVV